MFLNGSSIELFLREVISHEELSFFFCLFDHDDSTGDARIRLQGILNLVELDAQAAQLNLVVLTAKELDAAIVVDAGEVARAIGIDAIKVDEFFFGEFVAVDIATGDTLSADE